MKPRSASSQPPLRSVAPPRDAASKKKSALWRMLRIHEHLREAQKSARRVNCSTLAEALEVSPKTVQRDLNFMRAPLALPIEYDESTKSYGYDAHGEVTFPIGHNLTPDERIALAVARQSLEVFEGVEFGRQLRAAHDKLTGGLFGDGIHAIEGDLGAYLSVRTPGAGRVDPDVFAKVKAALVRHKVLRVEYRGLSQSAYSPRRLQPLHLACVANRWLLIAHDIEKGAVRNFILSRFRGPQITPEDFRRPEGFDPDRHLGSSFGAWTGTGKVLVRLRIQPGGAHHVLERRWHRTQRETFLPRGVVEVSFELGDLHDIARWILGFGADCEVLEPESLRAFVAHEGRRMAAVNAVADSAPGQLGERGQDSFVGFMSSSLPRRD